MVQIFMYKKQKQKCFESITCPILSLGVSFDYFLPPLTVIVGPNRIKQVYLYFYRGDSDYNPKRFMNICIDTIMR